MMRGYAKLAVLIALLFSTSACSLFFGNIRPVEEKSKDYEIPDLTATYPHWSKVDRGDPSVSASLSDTSTADMTFQSNKTGSVISISSACKKYQEPVRTVQLSDLTHELLLGVSSVSFHEEKNITLGKHPAMQTTMRGTLEREKVMLRTIVLKKEGCVFDLMYVATPNHFEEDEPVFSDFASSLKLR